MALRSRDITVSRIVERQRHDEIKKLLTLYQVCGELSWFDALDVLQKDKYFQFTLIYMYIYVSIERLGAA